MPVKVIAPAPGCRVVADADNVILFGQPPEVLKGILQADVRPFDTLVLPEIRERDGSLLNHLEFPFYYFLFVAKGLEHGRRLRLIGSPEAISHQLRLLRLTLLGPTDAEFDAWGTPPAMKQEWLAVSRQLALSDDRGNPLPVESFFDVVPFEDGVASAGNLRIIRKTGDHYRITDSHEQVEIDLAEDSTIRPTYSVRADYIPGGLVKMGLEVLGGASGFSVDEPCTGLALCYNGDYMLIDALPFLDENLKARGIAKNQISALFLTHLHDDHCAMFPLMLMPRRVEVITTREIFDMAMEKLSLSLGWSADVVREHFSLIEVTPGEPVNYFGLTIEPHVTVHSVPTIGATFSTRHNGHDRSICVVGDNHSMDTVRDLAETGIVSRGTLEQLERAYGQRYDMLVADGGAGAIHGNPIDSIDSKSDRVVFVHVDELSPEFTTTFSLASAGKRYTVLEGDESLYTSQVSHFLSEWLGRPFPNRWMRSLLADEDIRRFNQDDVIMVQDSDTRGFVYLILTGYCNVVRHDGTGAQVVASLQAGDVVGEMAVITGTGVRNASVVAASPVSVCVFSEDIFRAFIEQEDCRDMLLSRWAMRPVLKHLPQFAGLSSTGIEKLGCIARLEHLESGDVRRFDDDAWYLFIDGHADIDGEPVTPSSEFGWRPFGSARLTHINCTGDCRLVRFPRETFERLRLSVPHVNYLLRKFRCNNGNVDWLLGEVSVY